MTVWKQRFKGTFMWGIILFYPAEKEPLQKSDDADICNWRTYFLTKSFLTDINHVHIRHDETLGQGIVYTMYYVKTAISILRRRRWWWVTMSTTPTCEWEGGWLSGGGTIIFGLCQLLVCESDWRNSDQNNKTRRQASMPHRDPRQRILHSQQHKKVKKINRLAWHNTPRDCSVHITVAYWPCSWRRHYASPPKSRCTCPWSVY